MKNLKKIYRPSGSERWSNCTASVGLDFLTGNLARTSPAAAKGHELHAIACDINTGKRPLMPDDNEDVKAFCVACKLHDCKHFEFEVPTYYNKRITGTVDALGYTEKHLTILDLKTGIMPVAAAFNKQLAIYARSVIKAFGLGKIEKITLGIAQFGRLDYWETTPSALAFLLSGVDHAADNIKRGRYDFDTSNCNFCPALAVCRPKNEQLLNRLMNMKSLELQQLTDSEKLWILQNSKQIETLIDNLQQHLLATYEQTGQLMPGTCVKLGAARQVWKLSESELIAKFGDKLTKQALLSPAAARKVCPECADFIELKNNKTSIVAE